MLTTQPIQHPSSVDGQIKKTQSSFDWTLYIKQCESSVKILQRQWLVRIML